MKATFVSQEKIGEGRQTFTPASSIPQDHFAYIGEWTVGEESAAAQPGAALEIRFRADQVFLVIGPRNRGDRIKILLDGSPVDGAAAGGTDVRDGALILDAERLYHLIDLRGSVESHLLRLEFENEGTAVYAFTFG